MVEQSVAGDIKNFIENTNKHIEVVAVNEDKKSVTIKLKSSTYADRVQCGTNKN